MSYPQPPWGPHQPATPPSPKRRKLWPWVVGGVAVVLVTVAVTSGGGAAPTPAPSNATGPASAPTAAPSSPATTVADGTHEVGVDVEPGKYKTPGSSACYWARLKENDGSLGDIIDNGFSSGPQVTTLRKGEYFQSQGCETWAKVG